MQENLEKNQVDVDKLANPLLDMEVAPIQDWGVWLTRWFAASVEEKIGLLHCGFDVPLNYRRFGERLNTEEDRRVFYLTVADGWTDPGLLYCVHDGDKKYNFGYDKNGNRIQKTPSELKQQIALKAFKMLCKNFFSKELVSTRDYDFTALAREIIGSKRLFEAIRYFFRFDSNHFGQSKIINFFNRQGLSPEEKIARSFLFEFVSVIWSWKEQEVRSWTHEPEKVQAENVSIRASLDETKPWTIEVLNEFDELRRLYLYDLNQSCLDKLLEIALRHRITDLSVVRDYRPVKTLEEACFVGSGAGLFLMHYNIRTSERKRLIAILNAEQARDEAERRVRELSGKK